MLLLYGVVSPGCPPIAESGVARADVYQIDEADLTVLVSDFEGELLARRRDVNAHMDVLEEAMRNGPVLPFRFGTLADNEDRVREMTRERSAELHRQLAELNGFVQVTLRITHDEEEAIRFVVTSDSRLRRRVRAGNRGADMADRIAFGESIATAVAEQAEADRRSVLERVLPLVEDVAESEDSADVLSLAALVKREQLSPLDSAVAELAELLGERAQIDYAGPMPAYSFVNG